MSPCVTYQIPRDCELDQVLERVKPLGRLHLDPKRRFTRQYFDTFDWRLYRKGLLLFHDAGRRCLFSLETQSVIAQDSGTRIPSFAREFEDSAMRACLAPVSEIRALLPLFSIRGVEQRYRLLDGEEKTVLRLGATQGQLRNKAATRTLPMVLNLTPLKGYEAFSTRARTALAGLGMPVQNGLFEVAAKLVGLVPGENPTKAPPHLSPEQSIRSAIAAIIHHQLFVMDANLPGVLHDTDTEFLHDYRVAVRRIRTCLSEFKALFQAERLADLKAQFKTLGNRTGPTRDMDVYLLDEESFLSMLPESMQPWLHPFFEAVGTQRKRARRVMTRALKSQTVRTWREVWGDEFSPTSGTLNLEAGQTPVKEVACQAIWKRYRQIRKRGSAIDDASPPEKLHALRIQCKRMRYLLEFFHSLFDPTEIKDLIKRLKRLQDCLGEYNDLSVQQHTLLTHRDPAHEPDRELWLAMGFMAGTLRARQREVRATFASRFAEFTDPKTHARFESWFKDPGVDG